MVTFIAIVGIILIVLLLRFFLSCFITGIQILLHPFKDSKGKVWNKWEADL